MARLKHLAGAAPEASRPAAAQIVQDFKAQRSKADREALSVALEDARPHLPKHHRAGAISGGAQPLARGNRRRAG